MVNKTQVCNLKIWIKETLSLSKAREVISENIILLKYQKDAITAALNGKDALMLWLTTLTESWIYQALLFIVSRDTSQTPHLSSWWRFYWCADHEFYARLGMWNCKSVWPSDKFVRKLMLMHKHESSIAKTLIEEFVSTEGKSSMKKESLQDEGSVTKFSYQMLLWISCKVT